MGLTLNEPVVIMPVYSSVQVNIYHKQVIVDFWSATFAK